jgi:hypothetical protein
MKDNRDVPIRLPTFERVTKDRDRARVSRLREAAKQQGTDQHHKEKAFHKSIP